MVWVGNQMVKRVLQSWTIDPIRTNGMKEKVLPLRHAGLGGVVLSHAARPHNRNAYYKTCKAWTEKSLSSIDMFSLFILLQVIFLLHIGNGQVTQCVIAPDKAVLVDYMTEQTVLRHAAYCWSLDPMLTNPLKARDAFWTKGGVDPFATVMMDILA